MHMKSSTGLDGENFGHLHSNILKLGNNSILSMKPAKKSPDRGLGPFLPALSPATNPLLQYPLSPVSLVSFYF